MVENEEKRSGIVPKLYYITKALKLVQLKISVYKGEGNKNFLYIDLHKDKTYTNYSF